MTHEDAIDMAALYVLGRARGGRHGVSPRAPRNLLGIARRVRGPRWGRAVPARRAGPRAGGAAGRPRDRIMAAAAADLAAEGLCGATAARDGASATPVAPSAPIAFPSAPEREARARARTGRIGWAMRIAAVVAIVALGGWNLLLQNELNGASAISIGPSRRSSARPRSPATVRRAPPGEDSQASGIAAVRRRRLGRARDARPASDDGQRGVRDLGDPSRIGPGRGWWVHGRRQRRRDVHDAACGRATGATIAVTREPKAGNTAPEGPVVSAGVAVGPST